ISMAVVVGGTPQSVYIKGQDEPLEVNFPVGVMTLPVEVTSPVTISMLNEDASGRVRVSNLITLGDYKSVDNDPTLYYDIKGTGSYSHSTTEACTTLTVTAGQWLVMQTYQFHNYASGKSHLPELTFINLAPTAGVVKTVGYFSSAITTPFNTAYDGIYLQTNDTAVNFVVNRNGTPTITVPQSAWDDPLDGTGASGKTVNWANFLPVFFDFLWLGGTRVRLWVLIDGEPILAHTYKHANNAAFTMIRQPSQPIRFEIRSTTGVGSLKAVCAAVSTEGALSPVGNIRSANNGTAQCDADVAGTQYAVLGIKLKQANRYDSIDIVDINILSATNDKFLWELILNPTVANTFTYNDITGSSLQYALGDTPNTVSGGYVIQSGYGTGGSSITLATENARHLGSTLDGVMDTLVLCVMPFSNNMDVYGSLIWRERR
ncbi:hypothetical protein KDA11_01685, partial [Candidatus Saccharibacteria bacterium]|nr:hypothetical protein [Candidatus Saccharibacteria bacterium]